MAPPGFRKAKVEQEVGPASLLPGEYPSRHLSSASALNQQVSLFTSPGHFQRAASMLGAGVGESSIHYNTLLSWV